MTYRSFGTPSRRRCVVSKTAARESRSSGIVIPESDADRLRRPLRCNCWCQGAPDSRSGSGRDLPQFSTSSAASIRSCDFPTSLNAVLMVQWVLIACECGSHSIARYWSPMCSLALHPHFQNRRSCSTTTESEAKSDPRGAFGTLTDSSRSGGPRSSISSVI